MSAGLSFQLIGGDDEFLVDSRAVEAFNRKRRDFGDGAEIEMIDGRFGTVDEVSAGIGRFISAAQNLSLFNPKRIVWMRQATFLGETQVGKTEGAKSAAESLSAFLKDFSDPDAFLLISGSPVDRRRSFTKWVESAGALTYIALPKDSEQLIPHLLDKCGEEKVKIDHDAAAALIERVNGNPRMIMNELDKLITYVMNNETRLIDYECVNSMVPPYGEGNFFELADAFYTLNLESTLRCVRKHFFSNKDARGVLGNLQSRNRLLIQLRTLHDGGWVDLRRGSLSKDSLGSAAAEYALWFSDVNAKADTHPFGQNPFYLSRLAKIAARLTLKTLIDFQLAFIETFVRIIDHPNDQEQIIQQLVLDCLGRPSIERQP